MCITSWSEKNEQPDRKDRHLDIVSACKAVIVTTPLNRVFQNRGHDGQRVFFTVQTGDLFDKRYKAEVRGSGFEFTWVEIGAVPEILDKRPLAELGNSTDSTNPIG